MGEKMINKNLTPVEISYIAGFFDGEGSVYIRVSKQNRKKEYHNLAVRLVNTNKEVMVFCRELLKLDKDIVTKKYLTKNYRKVYELVLLTKEAEEFLEMLFPYLIVKKKQALLALEFRKTIYENSHGRNGVLSKKDIFEREQIRQKIKDLNKGRGVL